MIEKITNEKMKNVAGGFLIEKKTRRKIKKYTDPGTHTSAHKYIYETEYVVSGCGKQRKFKTFEDAINFAKKYDN